MVILNSDSSQDEMFFGHNRLLLDYQEIVKGVELQAI